MMLKKASRMASTTTFLILSRLEGGEVTEIHVSSDGISRQAQVEIIAQKLLDRLLENSQ